jgi:WD40 repeat protein
LVGSGGEGIRVWDTRNGALLRQFGAPFSYSRVAVSSNASEIIATTVSNSVLCVWEANSGRLLHSFDHGPSTLWWPKVWLSRDGRLAATKASGYYDVSGAWQEETNVRLWDLSTRQLRSLIPVGTNGLEAGTFSTDGTRFATRTLEQTHAGESYRLSVWDTGTGQPLVSTLLAPSLSRDVGLFRDADLAVSPENNLLLGGGEAGAVLCDGATGNLPRTLIHTNVNDVTFLPDGKTAVTGSRDGTVKLWDTATGQLLRTLSASPQPMVFGGSGETILIRSETDGAREINLWTGAILHEFTNYVDALLTGDFSSPYSNIWSPDGRKELRQSSEYYGYGGYSYYGILDVFDIASSNVFLRVGGDTPSSSFSPDGRFIATSAADYWNLLGKSWMTLWDAATGHPIRFFEDTAERLGFSPDGLLLVSEHDDGTASLWDLRDLVVGLRVVTTAQGRELRWEQGRLQEADSITGPWRDAWDASSPLRLGGAAPQKFYRVVAH